MNEECRPIAWAIAEAWWRKNHRQVAGVAGEAESPADYADRFWQSWVAEARAAARATEACSCQGGDAISVGSGLKERRARPRPL